MNRIFLSLATLSTLLLVAAFVLGLNIDDSRAVTEAASNQFRSHFWTAMAGLLFAALVHAIVLTYFMGTGRWMEEVAGAYRLGDRWKKENQSLKFRTLPLMTVCLLLLILTGAFGAAADTSTARGLWGLSSETIKLLHFLIASTTLCVNFLIYCQEYAAICCNGRLVQEVLGEVRRIREEKGLPV